MRLAAHYMLSALVFSHGLVALSQDSEYISSGANEEASLGAGWNSRTKSFQGVGCLVGTPTEVGRSESQINLDMTTEQKSVAKELGVSANVRYKFTGGSTSASASFLKNSQTNSRSLVYHFVARYDLKNMELKSPKRNSEMSELSDDLKWLEGCGDMYISQLKRGGRLVVTLRVDFSSKKDKDLFQANFSVNGSFGSASAALRNAKDKFSKRTSVSLSAIQIGGDVAKLGEMLDETGTENVDGVSNFLKCSMGDISRCETYLTIVQRYIATNFTKQLDGTDSKNSGPATLGYLAKKYIHAGVVAKFPPSVNEAILNTRKRVDEEFDKNLRVTGLAQSLLREDPYPLTPEQRARVKGLQSVANSNIEAIVETAILCYNEPDKCIDSATQLTENILQPIDPQDLVIEPQMFRQFCYEGQSQAASPELQSTILTMLEVAKSIDPNTFNSGENDALSKCDLANSILQSTKIFNVTSITDKSFPHKIYTLEPLLDMTHLEEIHLADQKVSSLIPLRNHHNLRKLDLSNNRLRTFLEIKDLENLQVLQLSDNRIRTTAGAQNLRNLRKLDLRNNAPDLECPTGLLNLKICMLESYRGATQIVAQATHSRISMDGASVAKLNDERVFIAKHRSAEILNLRTNQYETVPVSLLDSRSHHTATTLQDGRVLLVGGEGGGSYSAEVFDPNATTFTEVTRVSTSPRSHHEALLLDDGRVLITGGFEADGRQWDIEGSTPSAEIFDPLTNTMNPLPSMLAARQWHRMTKLNDGRVLITGGYSNNGGQTTAELFDPTTNAFHLILSPMTSGRAAHGASLLPDGRVLLSGGIGYSDNTYIDQPKDSLELYNPTTESFEEVPDKMKYPRAFHTQTTLPSGHSVFTGGATQLKELLIGARKSLCSSCVAYPEIFNPKENSISTLGDNRLSHPRARHFAIPIGASRVYLMGGVHQDAANTVEVFTHTLK